MTIRKADINDIPDIERLLRQICTVHSVGRPDLFKADGQKYNTKQIKEIIEDESRPLFVAFDEDNQSVIGYAMCIVQKVENNTALHDMKTLYLDDLCVDENIRGQGIGKKLYEFLLDYSKKEGFYNLTLNVWESNKSAKKFYEKCGLSVQKTTLEKIL